MFDADKALALVRRLDFPRPCGSPEEARAQEIISEEIHSLGLDPIHQEFAGWWIEPERAVLDLPDRTIEIEPAIPLPFLAAFPWMERVGLEVEITGILTEGIAGQPLPDAPLIALRDSFQPESAVVSWAAAQLLLFPPIPEFIPYALIADPFVPSAYVPPKRVGALRQMVRRQATLSWRPRRCTRLFRNVVAQIQGTVLPHEVVVLGAHLDSFPGTVGSSDNAAGCAVIVETLRWFRSHPPERTVRFVWFTGEELDRRGSKAFVSGLLAQPEKICLFINSDGGFEAGTGPPWVRVSTESMKSWVRTWLRDDVAIEVRGSDGDEEAFQERQIPTFRATGHSRQSAHLPTDRPEGLDEDKLALIGRITVEAALRATQAASALPVV